MAEEIQTLIEMGFSKAKARKALSVTNNKGVEPAMEWLLQHAEDPDEPETVENSSDERISPSTSSIESPAVAKSLKCEECGKLFNSQEEVEFHAAKSGHSSFSESTEEKKPMTEEEKKEQLAKLEERMKQKRKEREEREKGEALEKERFRIRSGKDMQDAKQRIQDQEMQKMIEQRRRDKLEDQQARDRVRQQIEADKQARRLAAGAKSPEPEPMVVSTTSIAPKVSYDKARLQLRLPDGKNLTHTFGAKEQLAAVRLFVEINAQELAADGQFILMTTFPKRVFTTDDYDKPLDVLGLVPSAVVIVSKAQRQ